MVKIFWPLLTTLQYNADAADVVFAPNLDDYYGTKVDVECSIERGMEVIVKINFKTYSKRRGIEHYANSLCLYYLKRFRTWHRKANRVKTQLKTAARQAAFASFFLNKSPQM